MQDDEALASADASNRRAAAVMRLARIRLLENIAIINAVLIGLVALSVGYELLGTDIRSIAALYYFAHFLIILPLVSSFETPKPLPGSITEAVLGDKSGAHDHVPLETTHDAPAGRPATA